MKPKSSLRHFLALAGSSLLAMFSANAQSTLYFDGGTTDIAGNGNGASAVVTGTHTWNTTIKNWDAGAVPYVAWNNANSDNAVIAGSGGGNKTITIATPVTVGSLTASNSGGGTLILSGSAITVNSGISLGTLAGLSMTAPIILGSNLNQTWFHNQGVANSTGKNITGGTTLNGHTLTWDMTNAQSNNRVTHSAITGTGNIIKEGTGWLGLGANTYIGSTTITAGTIDATNSTALGNANNQLTLNTGGTLNMAGAINLTVGNLTGTGGLITSTHTTGTRLLTIGSGDAGGGNFQGVIQNGSTGSTTALTKIGAGTITLSGANTYSGVTNVNGGTLLVSNTTDSGTGSNTVSVGALGTLGGTGTIAGATTINGNLNPGAGPGVLSFTSSLALNADSTTTMEINGTTRGSGYDGVNVGTTLGLGGDLVFDIGAVFGSSATFNLFDVVGVTSSDFVTVSLQGDMGTGTFDFDTVDTWSLLDGDNSWTFTQSNGELNLTVVPEPGAALLGSLGLLALMRRRR